MPTAMIGCELKNDSISSVIVDNELGGTCRCRTPAFARTSQDSVHSGSEGSGRQFAAMEGNSQFCQAATWSWIRGLSLICRNRAIRMSSFEAGYKLTEELVKQKRPFTALLAFDDMTAFGAIRALNKAGIRVPDHCSVIGFDDVATSAIYTPVPDHRSPAHGGDGNFGCRNRGRRYQWRTRKKGDRSDPSPRNARIGCPRVYSQLSVNVSVTKITRCPHFRWFQARFFLDS